MVMYINPNPNPFDRSAHLKKLHAEGRYLGTSKIGLWNQSSEKRERMSGYRIQNSLNKDSRGYGSEYHMRVANRTLLHNKFQGTNGYLYYLKFPGSVKVGFSKDWERRVTKQILGGEVIAIISGPTNDLADLEFDLFQEFSDYTKLDETGTRYTEFLEFSIRKKVYKYLKDKVSGNKNLRFEIQNSLS